MERAGERSPSVSSVRLWLFAWVEPDMGGRPQYKVCRRESLEINGARGDFGSCNNRETNLQSVRVGMAVPWRIFFSPSENVRKIMKNS